MTNKTRVAICSRIGLIVIVFLMTSNTTLAVNTDPMPWDTLLDKLIRILTGKIATSVAVIAIALAGYMMIFQQPEKSLRWLLGIIFGVSIAVFAVQILASFGIVTALM